MILAAAPAHAQVPTRGSAYAPRALERFFARIRTDPRLPDSLRQLTFGELDSLPADYFAVLDDSSVSLFLRSAVAILGQLPESLCARSVAPGNTTLNLLGALAVADSATIDAVLLVHERALLAVAQRAPRLDTTPVDARVALSGVVTGLPQRDQQRLLGIAGNTALDKDLCWMARTLFGAMAQLPPSELGPLFRALSRQPAPRN